MRKNKKIKKSDDPVSCKQCDFHHAYMKKIGHNHFQSQYVCTKRNNNMIPKGVLIPKWCPEGYEDLFS